MPGSVARQTITAWFAGKPITRAEVLAWEARRAAKALQRFGVPVPDGDVEARRSAVVKAKLALGRAEVERLLLREVGVTDRGGCGCPAVREAPAPGSGGARRVRLGGDIGG